MKAIASDRLSKSRIHRFHNNSNDERIVYMCCAGEYDAHHHPEFRDERELTVLQT